MKKIVYEKKLIKHRRPPKKDGERKSNRSAFEIEVIEDKTQEIKDYIDEGVLDLAWYLLESAIPDQVPYCEECLKNGYNGASGDNVRYRTCKIHPKASIKYCFKPISEENKKVNIKFAKEFGWFISLTCDASLKKIDSKKVINGIIDINKNNDDLTFKSLVGKRNPLQQMDNLFLDSHRNITNN